MEPTWKINWDYQGWRVELTQYPSPDEYVTVELKTDGISGYCIIYGTRIDPIEPPWPFNHRKMDPTNPAEVCAMCERLADQYNLEAKLAKLRVMQPGERLADQYTISPTPTER
jgi:hypothetical protein